jgi:phosphoesterase RecJ-like protein
MNIDILSPQECSRLSTLIETSQNIVITCHRSPDGDAIGSCLGWAEFLRTMGKEPTVIVPDQYPDFLHWMPNTEKIVRYDKRREQCDLLLQIADLVFCLDFNATSRVDEMETALLRTHGVIVLIDHHLNPDVPAELTISHPEACSTSEIVFRIVWQLGQFEKQGKHFAIPIYCGMMTDTGGFTFASTRPEIFFIISQLLTKRIDKDRIYRNVYHNYSENRLRLMGYVMYEKLVYLPEYHASYYTISKADQRRFNFIKCDAEGLVNLPQQIKSLKLSISLREDTEKDKLIWVSLRSVDDFPCNEMAEQFYHGGGHLNASGGRLQCTLDEAVDITRKAIEAFGKKELKDKGVIRSLTDAILENPSLEEILFGKMVAGNPALNVNACVATSHAISVHEVENQFDYFAAVDDLKKDENGAAHLGFSEFNSAIYHRCMAIDLNLLRKSTKEDIFPCIKEAINGFVNVTPRAKYNSYASVSTPYTVFVTATLDKPLNCIEAFLTPLPKNSSLDEASKCMYDWANDYFYGYGFNICPNKCYSIGKYEKAVNRVRYDEFLTDLEEYIHKLVQKEK